MTKTQSTDTIIAVMGNKIDDIKEKVTDINSKLEQKYVTQKARPA